MLRPDLRPRYLDEQECKEMATRQILSFITLPDTKEGDPPHVRPAPGASLFPFEDLTDEAFGDGPELFNWKSRDIYDVDGLLLFRDQTLDLGADREWHVLTAASDLLQTQAWCVCSHGSRALSDKALIENALKGLRSHPDLEPFVADDEENVRLVAYSHPNVGILCYSRSDPDARFVFKLGEPIVIPLGAYKPPENPQSLTAFWSPYDMVGRHTIAHYRQLWEQNMALLPPLPENREGLLDAIREARKRVRNEHLVKPKLTLIPQKTPTTCAVATALMILRHHRIDIAKLVPPVTEQEIAENMRCEPDGATPEDQVIEVNRLLALAGSKLQAVLDYNPTFDEARSELSEDRPLKIGTKGHARAVAGFRADLGGKDWFWIFDPLPENLGKTCCVPWTRGTGLDCMYVKPS